MQARQSRGRGGNDQLKSAVSQAQSDGASRAAQHQAFQKQARNHILAVCSQSCANSEFLTAAFDAHQQQVGYVRTCYEENDGDGPHQHPKHIADVTDYVNLERLESRGEIGLFKYLYAKSWWRWETVRSNRNQAGQISGGLLQSNSRFQTCQTVETETSKHGFTAINLRRHNNVHIGTIHELKVRWQNTDDLVHSTIQFERTAYN